MFVFCRYEEYVIPISYLSALNLWWALEDQRLTCPFRWLQLVLVAIVLYGCAQDSVLNTMKLLSWNPVFWLLHCCKNQLDTLYSWSKIEAFKFPSSQGRTQSSLAHLNGLHSDAKSYRYVGEEPHCLSLLQSFWSSQIPYFLHSIFKQYPWWQAWMWVGSGLWG